MDERVQKILKTVITAYIETGEPVGSRTISKKHDFWLSPATIRNIMADLEELGFLTHPYTSSGRIPTEKGYRYYIDSLISHSDLEHIDEEQFLARYQNKRTDISELMHETSQILSMLSHYTSVVTIPRFTNTIFKHLKFIMLDNRRILAIFVSQEGIVHNNVFAVDEDYTQKDLDWVAAYINDEFEGCTIGQIRDKLIEGMRMDKAHYNKLLIKIINKYNEDSFFDIGDIFLEGKANVLDHPEFSDIEKMKQLFKTFEEKYTILKFLNKCVDNDGVKVIIGDENIGISHCSLVVANYKDGNRVLGTIGVIGPTRMEYSRIIPLVDVTARTLTKAFSRE